MPPEKGFNEDRDIQEGYLLIVSVDLIEQWKAELTDRVQTLHLVLCPPASRRRVCECDFVRIAKRSATSGLQCLYTAPEPTRYVQRQKGPRSYQTRHSEVRKAQS
jgi:hypothetical protein